MADATQVQIRRDTDTNLLAATPALAELAYNVTTKRLHLGDGSSPGGTLTPNAFDMQLNSFAFAVAGGTANAITVSLSPAPGGYVQPLAFWFRATATNTGATNIDVNGLGTRNIYRVSGGSITSLEAGDIVSGGLYLVVYDGTQFQLYGLQSTGLVSVSQGDLNTSTGSFSVGGSGWTSVGGGFSINTQITTLPGGQYGFCIESFKNSSDVSTWIGWVFAYSGSSNSSRVSPIGNRGTVGQNPNTGGGGRQRYITSSPPFDLGDGEVGGFIYAVVDGNGTVQGHYAADVPPWGYNGPTDIRCTHKCPVTGKKYRKAVKKLTPKQVMDGAKIEYEMQEITHEIKNADMSLIPTPFEGLPEGHHVVLIDPMSDKVKRLIELQNAGDDIVYEMISKGHLKIENEFISRKGPKGINVCAAKYKGGK